MTEKVYDARIRYIFFCKCGHGYNAHGERGKHCFGSTGPGADRLCKCQKFEYDHREIAI